MRAQEKIRDHLAWLQLPCHAVGECDRCHTDAPLWQLPAELDCEIDAEWMYCEKCYRRIVARETK